jgi:hypothetical protein
MTPNPDLRIANCIKAIEQVVIPALPPGERLAREQAMLVIGHLSMISAQWKLALRYEIASLDAMMRLAEELQQSEPAYQAELGTALTAVADVDRSDFDAVERAVKLIGTVIDTVINGNEGTRPLAPTSVEALLTYADRQAFRHRTWSAGCGLDPDKADLPGIETVLT